MLTQKDINFVVEQFLTPIDYHNMVRLSNLIHDVWASNAHRIYQMWFGELIQPGQTPFTVLGLHGIQKFVELIKPKHCKYVKPYFKTTHVLVLYTTDKPDKIFTYKLFLLGVSVHSKKFTRQQLHYIAN